MSTLPAPTRSMKLFIGIVVIWFALAFWAGATGIVARDADDPPLRIALAAGGPTLIGIGLLVFSRRVREWAQGLDLSLLIYLQGWRMAGYSFLALYAQSLLPEDFSLAAGLGDIALAVTAPFVAVHVARRGRAAGLVFVTWTVLGIIDFIVAITLGAINDITAYTVLADGTRDIPPMAELPLSLIPTFFVPLLIIVHLLAYVRFRALPAQA